MDNHKRTFPSNWSVTEFMNTEINIIDGDRGKNYPKKEEFFNEGHCLFLNTSNIKEDSFDFSKRDFISEKKDALLRKGKLRRNDIVVTTRGTVGSVAFYNKGIKFEHIRINSGMIILRCSSECFPAFIYQLLKSSLLKEQYKLYSSGAAQPQLPIKDFKRIKLLLPTLPIQKKIAAVLSAYDDLIENNNRRIALLEKMAEEIYREWFVRMRFPGHEKATFKKGVPKEWQSVVIEKAFKFTGGGTPSKAIQRYWIGGDINWYTPSDITSANGIYLFDSSAKCTEEGLKNSSARLFPPYSIMMTSRATIGELGINTTYACTNQGFITCIPNEKYPLVFLYHWLKLNKSYFELLSSGATFSELIKSIFKKILILKPPKIIMSEFQKIVEPVFNEIEFSSKANAILKNSRSLFLSRLISGKLSVEDLDIKSPKSMEDAGA